MTNSRIYIGRLPQRASEYDIERFFKGYGRIREVVIKNGFGFVEFSDIRDAEDAVYDLNGKELCGDRVVLQFSRRHPRHRDRGERFDDRVNTRRDHSRFGAPYQTPYRLLVENLSTRCSWQDLKDMMRDAGEVTYADAHKIQKREGVICFATRSHLDRALDKFQGKEINGRRIKLIDDTRRRGGPHSPVKRTRSRSPVKRSRSRSPVKRSRSRSPVKRSRSRSPVKRSRSRSPVKRSRSRSPVKRSRSRSPSKRSRSRSPSKLSFEPSPSPRSLVMDETERSCSPA